MKNFKSTLYKRFIQVSFCIVCSFYLKAQSDTSFYKIKDTINNYLISQLNTKIYRAIEYVPAFILIDNSKLSYEITGPGIAGFFVKRKRVLVDSVEFSDISKKYAGKPVYLVDYSVFKDFFNYSQIDKVFRESSYQIIIQSPVFGWDQVALNFYRSLYTNMEFSPSKAIIISFPIIEIKGTNISNYFIKEVKVKFLSNGKIEFIK